MYALTMRSKEQQYAYIVILLPILVTIAFFYYGMEHHLQPFTITMFIVYMFVSGLGITVGFHRLLTHKSFQANRILKCILVCLGCTVWEGTPIFWVGVHRYHHQFSDTAQDPHSPHGTSNRIKSFINSHIGWMFDHNCGVWDFQVQDLLLDRDIKYISRHYLVIAVIGLFLPALINVIYYHTVYSFIEGLLLCGVIRVLILQNMAWSINSFCHVFGRKDFVARDNSRNNKFCGFMFLGEGWHNGHHAFPSSSRHGLLWWQLDVSYLMIKLFCWLGIAHDLKFPTAAQLQAKKI